MTQLEQIAIVFACVAVVGHIAYQVLLRKLRSWGFSARTTSIGMGMKSNLKDFVHEAKARGESLGIAFWILIVLMTVGLTLGVVYVIAGILSCGLSGAAFWILAISTTVGLCSVVIFYVDVLRSLRKK